MINTNNRFKLYNISEVGDFKKWDKLVNKSPQGTAFSLYKYLSSSGTFFKLFEIYKGSHLKAGLCIALSEDQTSCKRDELVIYNGILFKVDKFQKQTKARFEMFCITEFIINYLIENYKNIELALSPYFQDIRPFLWYNYHSSRNRDKFKVDVRYTSHINIDELALKKQDEDYSIFERMETIRQRNIREAKKRQDIRVVEGKEIDSFLNFYVSLMESQKQNVSQAKFQRMYSLIDNLLNKNVAIMTLLKNDKDEILYTTVFCMDQKRAYYLFGAGNPLIDERFKGTITFWETFKILAQKYGVTEIDFEGVNSPNRGWFKLSFGGKLLPYYLVRFNEDQ
jgi:hypothetical protein